MKPANTIINLLNLPPRMARQVEKAIKKEHHPPAQLIREALRTYFWLQGIPEESPTAADLRAIRRGRAEVRHGNFVNLAELSNALGYPRRKARSKRT